MNVKKNWKNQVRGWIPKEYRVAFAQKMVKPIWWKPLWIVSALGIIISALAFFLIGYAPSERIILGVVLAFLGLGVAYYIRVRPSITVNRVVYIGLGIGIGWVMDNLCCQWNRSLGKWYSWSLARPHHRLCSTLHCRGFNRRPDRQTQKL